MQGASSPQASALMNGNFLAVLAINGNPEMRSVQYEKQELRFTCLPLLEILFLKG